MNIGRRHFLLGSGAAAAAKLKAAANTLLVKEYRRGGMVYRRLGRTDLYPSLLCLGSHTDLAYRVRTKNGSTLTAEGQQRRDRHMAHALDLGVNTFDIYEHEGQWEPAAKVLRSHRNKVLISISRNLPEFMGDTLDRAVRLFGHADLFRMHINDFQRIDGTVLRDWDMLRKAREAGDIRALGISSHNEFSLLAALKELDDLDFVLFPYNFIHARADFMEFVPAATAKGVGLIAMKPLAMGSITNLDPRARSGPKPESEQLVMYGSRSRIMLPGVAAELTRTLDRLPDETLCQAAMRFVYSRPFVSAVFNGMWDDQWIDDNHTAMQRYLNLSREEHAALDAVAKMAAALKHQWLPADYRWLDERWRG